MPTPDGPQWNAVKHLISVNRQTFNNKFGADPTDEEVSNLGGRVGQKIDSTLSSNLTNLGSTWPYLEEEM